MRSFVLSTMLVGCTVTLPFDELTGGITPGGPKPKHWYKFEEKSGARAVDSVGGGDGDISNDNDDGSNVVPPTWVTTGHKGRALKLTDASAVKIGALSGTSFPPAGTLAAWYKIDALGENPTAFFVADSDAATGGPFSTFLSEGGVNIVFERNVSADDSRTFLLTAPKLGSWMLVAEGWDANVKPGRTILYVRADKGTSTFKEDPLPDGLVLGTPDFLITGGNGTIDEAKFYDRLLTQQELDALE